ncbi:helicase-related protein [Tessaracoccus lubricantis]|uniref:helicase-related protein n=1 Tax=Tessaracoccus lubricantis TaxID=545543 RepID=UPI0031EBBD47
MPISKENPGRRYIGVCASGVRLTAAEIRVSEVLMAGAQLLLDRGGASADPYLTMVAYFNATRELAGMARFMQDDIQTGLARGRLWSKLPRRSGIAFGPINHAELTSRVASSAITETLNQLAVPFDPDQDTNAARQARIAAARAGQSVPREGPLPFDAVLATSMLQVGVDVPRLGLMLLVGQPKNTAEYIQASSRVGRSADGPGLVVTLGNWARPRDLAHFEQFRHFHETFYAQVEALSVTPYSVTSIERGLEGVLVSAARVASGVDGAAGLSPESGANRVSEQTAFLDALTGRLVARALTACGEHDANLVKQRLASRLGNWRKRRTDTLAESKQLVYEKTHKAGQAPLMIGAEATTRKEILEGAPFVVPNSMREVQPEINLLVSPKPERLWIQHGEGAPQWVFPAEEE